MYRLIPIGRVFVALALIGLGIQHFIFRDFMTGRAPAWPASLPGGAVWSYVSGAVIVATGLAIITKKHARLASICAGVLILVWALLRHIPVVAGDSLLGPTWTRAGKALTFFGGAFAVAATLPPLRGGSGSLVRLANLSSEFVVLGRICLGTFLVITGIQHFLFTEFVASLIPTWFPGDAVSWTWFAGVCLIAGGVGLLIPRTAQLAALMSGMMVFSWFWIVHIPRSMGGVSDRIAVYEALAVSGIALVVAGFLAQRRSQPLV